MSKAALYVVFSTTVTIRCPECGRVVKKSIEHCVDKTAVAHECAMCGHKLEFQFRVEDVIAPQIPTFPE